MLKIGNIETDAYLTFIKDKSLQHLIATQMNKSDTTYYYKSADELTFELDYRYEITHFSRVLYDSQFSFSVFREVTANEKYWEVTTNGSMKLIKNVSSYDAILDIVKNGKLYSSECATAMVIVYFLALTKMYTKELFDKTFSKITLMNWHNIHPLLREIGYMNPYSDYFAGDRQYFDNPDVSLTTTHWQGENVINLGDGTYYGHGIGIQYAQGFVDTLNVRRKPDATQSAYMLDLCGRPNFSKLFKILE